jgi:hypothetical protein
LFTIREDRPTISTEPYLPIPLNLWSLVWLEAAPQSIGLIRIWMRSLCIVMGQHWGQVTKYKGGDGSREFKYILDWV